MCSEITSELAHVESCWHNWNTAVGVPQALPLCVPMGWGCLPEPFPRSRKKLIRMKTVALALSVAPRSGSSLAVTEEANSTCPQYQAVPDFQRVQITGDYASGVGTSMAAPFPMLVTPSAPCLSLSSAQGHRSVYQLQWGGCLPAQSVPHKHLGVPCCIPGGSRAESLSRSCVCCTLPMGFGRKGLAGRAVLSVTSSLLAHSSVCLGSVHIQGSQNG